MPPKPTTTPPSTSAAAGPNFGTVSSRADVGELSYDTVYFTGGHGAQSDSGNYKTPSRGLCTDALLYMAPQGGLGLRFENVESFQYFGKLLNEPCADANQFNLYHSDKEHPKSVAYDPSSQTSKGIDRELKYLPDTGLRIYDLVINLKQEGDIPLTPHHFHNRTSSNPHK